MCDPKHNLADVREVLEARNRQIAAVHVISRLLSSSLDLEDRLRHILSVALDAVGASAGTIYLYRPGDDTLVFRYVVGEKATELTGHAMNAASGLAGAVFRTAKSQITNRPQDAAEHDTAVEEKTGFATKSMMTVPLQYQAGRPVGVMQILNKQDGEFDHNDLAVLEIIASVAAASIETSHLAREAQTAAIAHAVGDLSHDIKNKVSPIAMAVYALRPDMDAMFGELDRIARSAPAEIATRLEVGTQIVQQAYREAFDIIMYQVEAVQEYTKLIADALKGTVSEPQLEPNDLGAVIEEQLRELDAVARSQGVALIRRLAPVPVCRFDRFQIERAVYNLVNNAIPETPTGGNITVAIEVQAPGRFPDGGFVAIQVQDTGRGMSSETLERILRGDPKSTKPGGTGLGTRIVYNAVVAHRGVLEGETHEGVGTTFRLKLPLLAE
jgi:signal transduction histidine kinase